VRRNNTGSGGAARRERDVPLAPRITEADRAAHRDFVASLGDNAAWRDYL
jgi:DNA polymerase-3 subunit epsilon